MVAQNRRKKDADSLGPMSEALSQRQRSACSRGTGGSSDFSANIFGGSPSSDLLSTTFMGIGWQVACLS